MEIKDIISYMDKQRFAVFTSDHKNYNLNIVGVRSKCKDSNVFNDELVVFWFYKGRLFNKRYKITTDPGVIHLRRPMHPKGTAIMVAPQQCRGVYKISKHQGKYDALCQRLGTVQVYRDNNKDDVFDLEPETIDQGYFGINIHRAFSHIIAHTVDNHSAGCQVFSYPDQYDEFMDICKKAAEVWGNKFTYTLIEEA